MNDRSGDNIVGDGLCAVPFAMDGIVFSLLAISQSPATPQSANGRQLP